MDLPCFALAVGGEIAAGVGPQNLCQMVAEAREAGRHRPPVEERS